MYGLLDDTLWDTSCSARCKAVPCVNTLPSRYNSPIDRKVDIPRILPTTTSPPKVDTNINHRRWQRTYVI